MLLNLVLASETLERLQQLHSGCDRCLERGGLTHYGELSCSGCAETSSWILSSVHISYWHVERRD